MTERMSPSEEFDLWNVVAEQRATIRELEARETRALAVAEHHADESMVLKAKLKIAEGDRDVARNDCDMLAERVKRYEYELKIATEALVKMGASPIKNPAEVPNTYRGGFDVASGFAAHAATQALARIKEVG